MKLSKEDHVAMVNYFMFNQHKAMLSWSYLSSYYELYPTSTNIFMLTEFWLTL